MDDQELERLALDLESDRVERKAIAGSHLDQIRQAVCAFANDLPDHRAPGVIINGLRDDGSCAGLMIDDAMLLRLAAVRDDGQIAPIPSLVVQPRTIAGCKVAVLIVQPSDAPPVRYNGRTWIRVGPRRATATPEEERRLMERRRWKHLPYDLHPVTLATLADLDLAYFRTEYLPQAVAADVIEANQRSEQQQLAGLRMVDLEGCPTVLGCLVLGVEPRRHVPGAYVQFVRFEGTGLTSAVRDQKEIGGRLADQLRRIEEVLELNVRVGGSFVGPAVEQRAVDYPLPALRQMVRNAVLHRSYEGTHAPVRVYWFEDRIEIHSPGGLFGQVTAETFTHGVTDYRNPHLAEAMKHLGFVQRFGAGFEIARAELARNGNPPLEAESHPGHVLITVRRRP
ncbi:MAG: putative DNA binding domain-containing protein [Kofleriaceae bacterium]|nr:putative DNA binding domain-containing protein [Kofleriaceae bacterium]MCL4224841.1 putative DNA binding domain-containing protein [Myxococcales bacterium]